MFKKDITFSSNKITIKGDEISAEGVPVRDIVESIGEADAVEHLYTLLKRPQNHFVKLAPQA